MNTTSKAIHPEIARLAGAIKIARTDERKRELLAELHALSQRLETMTQADIAEARHKQVMAELKLSQIMTGQAINQAYSDGYSAAQFASER